jgi:hypothetical protein
MRLTNMPGVHDERQEALTGNMSKADSQYVDDALTIEDEYESELAAVQVAYLKLAEAHKRFLGRNN